MSASGSSSQPAITNSSAFDGSLLKLQLLGKLTRKEIQDFQFASLDELRTTIDDIQRKQIRGGSLQCLIRIQPFIMAMEQYGKVIEVFLNTSNILAFVWGPMKFILQTASSFGTAFELILDTYQNLGESLPQFIKYEALFQKHSHMRKALEYIYDDILDFHRKVLKIFRHSSWTIFFKCVWQGLTGQIRAVRDNFIHHKSLLESEANLAHFEEAQISREHAMNAQLKAEQLEQRKLMINIDAWLAPAGCKTDHERYLDVQDNYPNTGKWLLGEDRVEKWLDPSCSDVPVVWLCGIPGADYNVFSCPDYRLCSDNYLRESEHENNYNDDIPIAMIAIANVPEKTGKTILASVVVENLLEHRREASLASPNININDLESIAFFYCRHANPERDNFLVVVRSLISQLIQQNPGMAPLVYEKMSRTGGITLVSRKDAEEFLKFVLTGISNSTYVVVDGLDECDVEQMSTIVTILTKLAKSFNAGFLRLFFTSRDENAIKKLFSNTEKLKIKPKNNQQDMKTYTHIRSLKIQEKFALSDIQRQELEKSVISRANGMFLFCTLVLQNLHSQSRKADFLREMEPNTFPSGLEDAYARIIQRLHNNLTPSQRQGAFQIMGLLAFAKRPLKKYEIQGFCSMDGVGNVDYENNSLRDDIKDLCGSLVEVCSEDTIEFIHATVKIYITQKRLMSIWDEKKITETCLAHLNSCYYDPLLNEAQIREFTLQGCYSTLDYLVIHWIDHVRAYVSGCSRGEADPIIPLLRTFFDKHWNNPPEDSPLGTAPIHDVCKLRKAFQTLEGSPGIIHKLVALSSVPLIRSIDPAFGMLACTKLGAITQRVRSALELLPTASTKSGKPELDVYYGTCWFKCPEEDCAYFSKGFPTRQARDEHGKKHNRKFFCPEPGCHMGTISCSSASALKAHREKDHVSTTPRLSPQPGRSTRYPTMSTTQNINGSRRITDTAKFPSPSGPQPLKRCPPWLEIYQHNLEDQVKELDLAPDKVKKGDDWFAVFNPDIPRTFDVDHLYTLSKYSYSIKFSHDGKYLAIGFDGAQMFDVDTGELVITLKDPEEEEDEEDNLISSLCFSPDDKYLATGNQGGLLKVWNIASESCECVFDGHEKELRAIDFARGPDGLRIATASEDGTAQVLLWTPGDAQLLPISVFNAPDGKDLRAVAFSPDARLIAVGSLDGLLYIWDISKCCVLAKLVGHTRSVNDVLFTNTHELYTASWDGTIKRWRLLELESRKSKQSMTPVTGMCVRTFTGHQSDVNTLALTPSREFLFSSSDDGGVHIYDPETGTPYVRLVAHGALMVSLDDHVATHNAPRPSNTFVAIDSVAVSSKSSLDNPNSYVFASLGRGSIRVWRLKPYSPQTSDNGTVG